MKKPARKLRFFKHKKEDLEKENNSLKVALKTSKEETKDSTYK
jgi:hypothetical protein